VTLSLFQYLPLNFGRFLLEPVAKSVSDWRCGGSCQSGVWSCVWSRICFAVCVCVCLPRCWERTSLTCALISSGSWTNPWTVPSSHVRHALSLALLCCIVNEHGLVTAGSRKSASAERSYRSSDVLGGPESALRLLVGRGL